MKYIDKERTENRQEQLKTHSETKEEKYCIGKKNNRKKNFKHKVVIMSKLWTASTKKS